MQRTDRDGLAPLPTQRAQLIARAFVLKGDSNNYAPGWHTVRSVPLLANGVGKHPLAIAVKKV